VRVEQITELQQQTVELRRQPSERDTELHAAHAASRDLVTRLDKTTAGRREQP